MARRLMAGHRSLEPAVVVRIHPGQWTCPAVRLLIMLSALAPAGAVGRATAQLRSAGSDTAAVVAASGDVRARARAAQARFERAREEHIPLTLTPGGGPCDEVVGRFCTWYGTSEWIPTPEPESVRSLRRELLEELDSLQRLAPAEGWILGQRVWYRGEGQEWSAAFEAARACGAVERWWCAALQGLALHELGRVSDAEEAFEQALAEMEPERAVRWKVPTHAIDDAARSWLRALERQGPAELAHGLERLWLLSDPLFLVEGNDRRTAHYARWTVATLKDGARNPFRLRWGRDLEELTVRHGWEIGWQRSRGRRLGDPFEVTGQRHPEAREYMPSGRTLRHPELAEASTFVAEGARPQSLHAPLYAPVVLPIEGQLALFPRRGRVAVVATAFLPEDTSFHAGHDHPRPWMEPGDQGGFPDQIGLFVVSLDGGPTGEHRRRGASDGALLVEVAPGPYVVSAESWSPSRRLAGRARFGITAPDAPPDVVTLSDLLLLRGAQGTPASLEEALEAVLPRAEALAGEPLALAWEVSGLGLRTERLGFSVSVRRLDRNPLRRLGERLGLAERSRRLALSWAEAGPERPGPHFRHLDLELEGLRPGRYEIALSLTTEGRTDAVARTAFRVLEPEARARPAR